MAMRSHDEDFSRGRKFSSDDLQLLLLALLADAPRHGYELMKLLAARSDGFYAPSPGMVYPALGSLESLTFTRIGIEGNRKRYALTDSGRAYLEIHHERVEAVWGRVRVFAQKMGRVRAALAGEDAGEGAGLHSLTPLNQARRKLAFALLNGRHASREEQLRIAQVLEKAAADIEAHAADRE